MLSQDSNRNNPFGDHAEAIDATNANGPAVVDSVGREVRSLPMLPPVLLPMPLPLEQLVSHMGLRNAKTHQNQSISPKEVHSKALPVPPEPITACHPSLLYTNSNWLRRCYCRCWWSRQQCCPPCPTGDPGSVRRE
jgi:hypothetical protein